MQTKSICLMVVLSCCVSAIMAERIDTVNGNVRIVAAADDRPSVGLLGINFNQLGGGYRLSWGVYPALGWTSEGQNSSFNLGYAFGFNRVENARLTETQQDLTSESHAANLGWNLRTKNVAFSFSDQFRRSPDFATFDLFQGILFTPEGMFFNYETITVQRNSYANTASLGLDFRVSERAHLNIRAGHSLREYEKSDLLDRQLPNQQRFQGEIGFNWASTSQTSINMGYRGGYNQFQSGLYNDSISHSLYWGISHSFTPTVQMSAQVGPSYGRQSGSNRDYWGYNTSVSVSKQLEREFISIYFNHLNAGSTGVGSVSKTDYLGFGLSHVFGQHLGASLGVTLFKTKGVLDNPYDVKGVNSSVNLSWFLGQRISLILGASYQNQKASDVFAQTSPNNRYLLDRRRIFATLQFALPELRRF